MTELFPICFFPLSLSLCSCEQAAHQRHIQQILCEIEPLCSTQRHSGYNSQYIQYGSWVCECQCDESNTDDAATRDHLHTSLTLGAFSILYPLFITFSSLPFNLCHQGRHQSEWQVVWSSSRAWWEKERCQHKYPSWSLRTWSIHGHHESLWSRADKHWAHQHGYKRHPHTLHSAKKHDQYCQFSACSWLFVHLYLHWQIMETACRQPCPPGTRAGDSIQYEVAYYTQGYCTSSLSL